MSQRKANADEYPGGRLCANCGQMWALHHTANYADGVLVGLRIEVCPTSVFKSKPGEQHPLDSTVRRRTRKGSTS